MTPTVSAYSSISSHFEVAILKLWLIWLKQTICNDYGRSHQTSLSQLLLLTIASNNHKRHARLFETLSKNIHGWLLGFARSLTYLQSLSQSGGESLMATIKSYFAKCMPQKQRTCGTLRKAQVYL